MAADERIPQGMPTWEQLQARVDFPLARPMYVVRPLLPLSPVTAAAPEDDDDEESGSDVESRSRNLVREPQPLGRNKEAMLAIFKFLSPSDLISAMQVCRLWSQWALDPSLWRSITIKHCRNFTNTMLRGIVYRQPVTLDLSWSVISYKQLDVLIQRLPQLQHLILEGQSWENVSCLASPFCPALKTLNLNYCEGIMEKTLSILLSAPKTHRPGHRDTVTRLRQLTSFSIAYTEVNDASIRYIVCSLPFLNHLDLSNCYKITDIALEMIVHPSSVVCHSLKSLDIRGCHRMEPTVLPYLKELPLLSALQIHPLSKVPLKAIVVWGKFFGFKCDDNNVFTRLAKAPDLNTELTRSYNETKNEIYESKNNDDMSSREKEKCINSENKGEKGKEDSEKNVEPSTSTEKLEIVENKETVEPKEKSPIIVGYGKNSEKSMSLINVSVKLEKMKDPESLVKSTLCKVTEKNASPQKKVDSIKLTLPKSKIINQETANNEDALVNTRTSKRRLSKATSVDSVDNKKSATDVNKRKSDTLKSKTEKKELESLPEYLGDSVSTSDSCETDVKTDSESSGCRRSERRSSGRRSKDEVDTKKDSSPSPSLLVSGKENVKSVTEDLSENNADKTDSCKKKLKKKDEKTTESEIQPELSAPKGKMEKDIITRSKKQKEDKDATLKKTTLVVQGGKKLVKKVKSDKTPTKNEPDTKPQKPIILKRDSTPVKSSQKEEERSGPILKIRMSDIKYNDKLRKKSTDHEEDDSNKEKDKFKSVTLLDKPKIRRRSTKDETKICDKSPEKKDLFDNEKKDETKVPKKPSTPDLGQSVIKKSKFKEETMAREKKKIECDTTPRKIKLNDPPHTSSKKDAEKDPPVLLSIKRVKEKDESPFTLSIKRGKDKNEPLLTSTIKHSKHVKDKGSPSQPASSLTKQKENPSSSSSKEKDDSLPKLSIKNIKSDSGSEDTSSSSQEIDETGTPNVKKIKEKSESSSSIGLKRVKEKDDSTCNKKLKEDVTTKKTIPIKDEASSSKKLKDSSEEMKLTRRPSDSSGGSNSPATKDKSSRERPERQHRSPRRLSMCQ